MEVINQIFVFLGKLLEWWFMVMPWEQAIFVRAGSNSKLLKSGLYFKIPFLDTVYIQTVRMHMIDVAVQTVSTQDNKTVTLKSVVGYQIKDMVKLYNSISHPEVVLASMAMGYISDFMRSHKADELNPKKVEEFVASKIDSEKYGLSDVSIKITSWADVKTFRLIQDASWMAEGLSMDSINDQKKK